MTKEKKNYFEILSAIDVNSKTKKKKTGNTQLTYLSWAWAWGELVKKYPNAVYEVQRYENNLPYVYDDATGYMTSTKMTIDGITHEMWLPVMDGSNKAMKRERYAYKVKEYKEGRWTKGYTDKFVDPATMFDINKTLMRCLVKNIAMFGLGLYIYADEDMPEEVTEEVIIEKVSKDQISKIEAMIKDADMNLDYFIGIMKIESVKDLPKSKFDTVIDRLVKRIETNKESENADSK